MARRSSNGVHVVPQMGLDESRIDNPELARLLDDRESAKEELQPYRLAFKGLDTTVKAKIEQLELADGTHRIGGFVVKVSQTEERMIEFERQSSRRVTISPAKT